MPEPHEELLALAACGTCKKREQQFESMTPPGRDREVWRVVCACGAASWRWSTTKVAAARMWNRFMAEFTPKRKAPPGAKTCT